MTFAAHVKGGASDELRGRFIEINPKIRRGDPVIKDTRISVYGLASRVADGDTIEVLCDDYPYVPREAIETALLYARTNPRRGRRDSWGPSTPSPMAAR